MTQAFIFDFDGTLVDSEQAIYECFQSITKKLAPNRLEYAKNILIGPPLRDTASEILGPDHQKSLDEFVQLFIEMHDEQVIQHTQPYPDVIQVLKQLHNQNIPMAIATNKRLAPTQKLLDHFGWSDYFQFIECNDSQSEMRNKDAMIQDIIKQNELFNKSYFVGDTVNDGLSANLNQLRFIKAFYGYGQDQDWSKIIIFQEIHKFFEVLNLL
ncbi:HAD family hydrolase [Methylophilaceae bacterium]|nr:HAD family hydrolase [Methylophilaceae bacterium]